MKRARRSARISQRSTRAWETRIKLLPGWKGIFRLAVGCWPGLDGHQPSSRSAQTRASPIFCGAWDSRYEDRQPPRRAEILHQPMSASSEQRKLAAIMFTDVLAYSSLAQSDDKLALELL